MTSYVRARNAAGVCLLFALLIGHCVDGQTPILFSASSKETLSIWPKCYFLVDEASRFSINDVLSDSLNMQFQSARRVKSTFGFTSATLWIQFKLANPDSARNIYLTIERVSLWEAELYSIGENGTISKAQLGVNVPFDKKSFQSKFSVYEIPPSKSTTYYLKLNTATSLFVAIYLDTTQTLIKKISREDLFNGIYVGVFVLVILYNILAFAIRRAKIYLWYLVYCISLLIYQGLFNTGLGFEYLWPNLPELNRYYPVASSLMIVAMILFTDKFLNLSETSPKFKPILWSLYLSFSFIALLNIVGFYYISKYFFWTLMLTFVSLLIAGVQSLNRGNKNAKLYLAGWSVLLIFYFYFALWLNGFIGESELGHRAFTLGSIFEMIIWFSAVSQKISLTLREEEERDRLLRKEVSRDFHDDLGNQAARLINYVGLLKIKKDINQQTYEELSTYAQNISDGAKDFVWSLDATHDDLNTVAIYLRDFAEQLLMEKQITLRFYNNLKDPVILPYGYSRQINLIFKEVITNSFKHSGAKDAEMKIDFDSEEAQISFRDNGYGVSYDVIQDSTRGFQNIRLRAKKINSFIGITSGKDGTNITLTIPLKK